MRSNISKANQRHFDQERLAKIILRPVISEKSTLVSSKYAQVVFKVDSKATKREIAEAIKMLFGVEASEVNVLNTHGKVKRRGKIVGRRKSWKKAYITLKEGQRFEALGLTE